MARQVIRKTYANDNLYLVHRRLVLLDHRLLKNNGTLDIDKTDSKRLFHYIIQSEYTNISNLV